jgi:hypothetical protein
MAYAFLAVVTSAVPLEGRARYRVVITETEGAATSEWSVTGLPSEGTITSYDAVKTGTAATLQPILSDTTAPATTQVGYIGAQAAAAASVHDRTNVRYQGLATLYGRSRPDAGADNAITTEITIVEGHI